MSDKRRKGVRTIFMRTVIFVADMAQGDLSDTHPAHGKLCTLNLYEIE